MFGSQLKRAIFFTVLLQSAVLANKEIIIDLNKQQLHAKEDGVVVLSSNISTGMVGHETPIGTFRIFQRVRDHESNLYPKPIGGYGKSGGAKMPYMLKFKNTGEAIHAGKLPGYPNSHGCVRIPIGNASLLFSWAVQGTKVTIVGEAPYSDRVNHMRKSMAKTKRARKHTQKKAEDNWGAGDDFFSSSNEKEEHFYDNVMDTSY